MQYWIFVWICMDGANTTLPNLSRSSNSSCIRSGGRRFESRRPQILGEKWKNGLETYDWMKNETTVWKMNDWVKNETTVSNDWVKNETTVRNERLGEKWNNGLKQRIGWKMKQRNFWKHDSNQGFQVVAPSSKIVKY